VTVQAIDIHVHLWDEEAQRATGPRASQLSKYFGIAGGPVSVDALADQYRERSMMAVLMNTTDVSVTGRSPLSNDHIAAAVRRHPDIFIGFGVVDPPLGRLAIDEARRCHDELGLTGIGELNPGRQHFYANDPDYYPLWEALSGLGMPVLFHTGMAGSGAGAPGGGGVKLKFTRPIPYLDDVAADFPDLTIIGAHPAWPYQDEALAVARHKSNYFIDLSGWAPRYFPPALVEQSRSILQDKVLFGTDWPAIPVDRWMTEFDALPFPEPVRRKIYLDNARKVLGIS
jgi:predicted TIM-barrel fold metal-dependent hydrolase